LAKNGAFPPVSGFRLSRVFWGGSAKYGGKRMTTKKRGSSPSGHEKAWPVTMAEAVFIARIRYPGRTYAQWGADDANT
jgi:hypothetical protein